MAFMDELQHLKIQPEEIKLATNNFSDNNIIGKGGFGKVYKGVLTHSKGKSIVALKRLDRKYGQGDPEFLKEIMLLSRYVHENLIPLLGFCNEGDEKILVYEYASRGSLDHHLGDTTLTWTQRLKICLAAAKGLSYLHEPNNTHQRVLHCDIKSANILLNENWDAKLSDFGLSKIGPANQQYTFVITNVIGTPGYCDPLYMETYTLTKESDVYSFGVVLLEVLCGRLCFEYTDGRLKVFVPMWKQRYEEKKLDEIIFQDLKQQMDSSSLKSFSDIAYQCLQKSREERPTMSHVLEKLEFALEYQKIYEGKEQPRRHEEIVSTDVPHLNYSSDGESDMVPPKGILLSGGKKGERGRPLPKFGEWDENDHASVGQLYKGPPLPKFGEWDVDDTALREGFTVIFNKARDEKKKGVDQESQETQTNAYPGRTDAGPGRKGKSIWRRFW